MIRLLLGVNLFLSAVLMMGAGAAVWTAAWEADSLRYELQATQFELQGCQSKHFILIKQIKTEGLWKRLGMPGQPWLGEHREDIGDIGRTRLPVHLRKQREGQR